MLSIPDALAQVLALALSRPLGIERIAIDNALGRILAETVISDRSLPPFDNAAMDGYALRLEDGHPGMRLKVVGESQAGGAAELGRALGPREAVRIFTGAPIPQGAEAVVMQEQTRREDGELVLAELKGPVPAGDHIRRAGSDVAAGSVLVASGSVLGPGELALLSACGRCGVLVKRRPRVAILCTGSELRYPDEEVEPGQIINSNAVALAAMVREAGGAPTSFPIIEDSREAHHQAFDEAASFDLILTSGGVSVGDHDLVQPVLEERGWVREFWKVAMKPGKPVLYGALSDEGALLLGLPGNPASSMVAFELFGRPLIRSLLGHPRPFRIKRRASLSEAVTKAAGRALVLRGRLLGDVFQAHEDQGSGRLRSMVEAEALALLPASVTARPAGAEVDVLDLLHDGAEAFEILL